MCNSAISHASTSMPPIVPRERFGADLGDPARVCDLDLG